jgi:hypothetical protein
MSAVIPLTTQTHVIEGRSDSFISRALHRWLVDFRSFVGFGAVPVGGIVGTNLTLADVTGADAYFDATGLGLAGRWQGWAICNGNNGTPVLADYSAMRVA